MSRKMLDKKENKITSQFDRGFLQRLLHQYGTKQNIKTYQRSVYFYKNRFSHLFCFFKIESSTKRSLAQYSGSVTTVDRGGFLHSYNDCPVLATLDGNFYWYKNSVLHRNNGPAIIAFDGTMFWYVNDGCFREDGSTIINPDGSYSFS